MSHFPAAAAFHLPGLVPQCTMLGVHFWQNWVTHAKNDCAKIFKALHLLEIFAPQLMTVDAYGLLLPSSSSSSSFHPIISCLRKERAKPALPTPWPLPSFQSELKEVEEVERGYVFFALLRPRFLKGGENEEAVKEGDKKSCAALLPFLSFSAISSRRGRTEEREESKLLTGQEGARSLRRVLSVSLEIFS